MVDGFTLEEFFSRVDYMVNKVAAANPTRPVVCITLYPYCKDLCTNMDDQVRAEAFRHKLREAVVASRHRNLHLIEGYVEKLIRFQQSGESVDKPRAAISKLLTSSRGGTQRGKDIVQNLRTFSRMDQAEVDEADLNAEIETTLGLVEPHLKGGISLERDFGDLPRVRCLPGQLNQVFMNLLMNARDALEGKGRILVRTRTSEMGVALFFEDDGPGIPEEVRSRMFDPFFTTKPVGKGTGLGLAITHEIIERHGGRMDVQCPETGGTIFRIDLPLAARIDPEEFEPAAS